MGFCHNMVSLIGLLFFSRVWSCGKGFYFLGVGVREVWCGKQCVVDSGCHQFATQPTVTGSRLILHSVYDRKKGFGTVINLAGRELPSLEELDKSLDDYFRSQDKRNERESASRIQDLVDTVPQITVSIYAPFVHPRGLPPALHVSTGFLLRLGLLVLKFRTKLRLAFSTADASARLLQLAIEWDYVELAKLVVAMEPDRISNNLSLCPTTVVAKVLECESMPEVITFLFEICHNPLHPDYAHAQPTLFRADFRRFKVRFNVENISERYVDLFFKYIGPAPLYSNGEFLRISGNPIRNIIKWHGHFKRYGLQISKSHQIQELAGVWNLAGEVKGLSIPANWSKKLKAQVLELRVSLKPVVAGDGSMTIGVQNVSVNVQNAYLVSSRSDLLGFFASHITVSIRPEVEKGKVTMLLGLPSPNNPYQDSVTRLTGSSKSATVGNTPGVTLTLTESSSETITATTTDWRYEQTREGEFTGNVSWTLGRLAGVRFDYAEPKCTKMSTWMSIFKPKPVASVLEPPFNSDGSVTFISEQCPIKWIFAPELAGTDVEWYVSATVHVTMLDRSTGKGQTLEFWFPDHFRHNMSTDVECPDS